MKIVVSICVYLIVENWFPRLPVGPSISEAFDIKFSDIFNRIFGINIRHPCRTHKQYVLEI